MNYLRRIIVRLSGDYCPKCNYDCNLCRCDEWS